MPSYAQKCHASSTLKWALLALMLMLAGCKEDIYSKQTELSANQMLRVLLNARIDAQKVSADGKTWSIAVESNQVGQALSVLHDNGLPGESRTTLCEVFKKDGLISTPAEERVRFICGVSQELEQTLSSMDGVVVARVHVVLPNNDPLADSIKPSSASVFIKYRPDANMATIVPVVKNLIVRSVEGLRYDAVNVTAVAAETSSYNHSPDAANRTHWWLWAGIAAAILMVAAALGAFVWHRRKQMQHDDEDVSDGPAHEKLVNA